VAEGDQYNPVQLDNAKSRIRSLGFFNPDTVDITDEPGSAPDRSIVKVKVEEEATGELAFSAGFSSQDAFLFSASAQQRNFRGRGQYLSARIQTTSRQQDLEFRFTEPKFQDRNLAVGLDVFVTQSDFFDIAGFENSIIGAGGRLQMPLSDTDQLGLRYRLRNDNLQLDELLPGEDPLQNSGKTNCQTVSIFQSSLCDQRGDRLTSSLGYTITMNRKNDYIEATRGFDVNFSQDIAGLGGDVNYLRNEFEGSIYHGFAPGWRLRSRLEAGLIESWGDEGVRINDRFFKGGNSFRGFDVAGLGPREVEYAYATEQIALAQGVAPPEFSRPQLNTDGTQAVDSAGNFLYVTAQRDGDGNLLDPTVTPGNALGGKAYAIASLELSFPLPYVPDEFGLDGAFFFEAGTVGLLDERDRERSGQPDPNDPLRVRLVDDSASLRASAGVSIGWDSPFGPIRFDFSHIIASEEYDRTESFRFATNTRF
jgi:outer membrane protein insertion porin family